MVEYDQRYCNCYQGYAETRELQHSRYVCDHHFPLNRSKYPTINDLTAVKTLQLYSGNFKTEINLIYKTDLFLVGRIRFNSIIFQDYSELNLSTRYQILDYELS